MDNDAEMVAAIFPSGIQDSVLSVSFRLNQREIPLPLQLADGNPS
jgi:hypothetical protein